MSAKITFVKSALLFLVLFLAAPVSAGQVKVVVSIHPLSDLVGQVGKDRVAVKTLLPPAASEHTFEPTPRHVAELTDASAFIKIGAGLEMWAEKVVHSVSNKKMVVVDLSAGMPLIYGTHGHEHEHEKGRREKEGKQADPHYWLDPVLVKKMVNKISEVLIKLDPSNGAFYRANAAAYAKELDDLDREIKLKTGLFKSKEYITFHRAWDYFSKRYGLKVAGVIEEAPGREPAPRDVRNIINELKRVKAKVVFAEPQFSPKIAEAIAKEAGAKVLFLDPVGSPDAPDRATYLKLMRYNLSQMEKAMK